MFCLLGKTQTLKHELTVGVYTESVQEWARQQSGMEGGGLMGSQPSLLNYLLH